MGRKKTLLSASRTDAEDIAEASQQRHAGTGNGIDPQASRLASEILVERRNRLQRQNLALDFHLRRVAGQHEDVEQLRRDAQRRNSIVRQTLHVLAAQLAEQLSLMNDPTAIRRLLHEEFSAAFADLAFAHGGVPRPDSGLPQE